MKNLEKLAELAQTLPAKYKANAVALVEKMGEILEGFGDNPVEWRPENLKVVQGTSDRSKLPKNATIGSMILKGAILEQPLSSIPLRIDTTRQYWNPDPEKAQMICSSPDDKVGFNYGNCKVCPYSVFDKETNKSQCNKNLSILNIAEDFSTIFWTNFSKTNYASGTDWQKLMRGAGVSTYKRPYHLSTETSKKSKNVEVIKAEPILDAKIEGAQLLFVEELYRLMVEERKNQLVRFYEYVESRKTGQANASLAAPTHVVELLSAPEDNETVPFDTSTETTEVVSKGKSYKL